MNTPKLAGVYTARFPYIEGNANKIRPVIVISKPYGEFGIVAIVPISSKENPQNIDVEIVKWREAGLVKSSVARVHRLTTMLKSDLIAELGVLETKDKNFLKAALKIFLEL